MDAWLYPGIQRLGHQFTRWALLGYREQLVFLFVFWSGLILRKRSLHPLRRRPIKMKRLLLRNQSFFLNDIQILVFVGKVLVYQHFCLLIVYCSVLDVFKLESLLHSFEVEGLFWTLRRERRGGFILCHLLTFFFGLVKFCDPIQIFTFLHLFFGYFLFQFLVGRVRTNSNYSPFWQLLWQFYCFFWRCLYRFRSWVTIF